MHRQQNHTPPSALALFEKIICSCLALMELADILSRGAARRGARIWIDPISRGKNSQRGRGAGTPYDRPLEEPWRLVLWPLCLILL